MLRDYKIIFKKTVCVESFPYTLKAENKEEAEKKAKRLYEDLGNYGDELECQRPIGDPTIEVTPVNEKQASFCIKV